MVDADLLTLENYIVEQIDKESFILKHEQDCKEEFLISMHIDESGRVIFDGLPESMKKHLNNFSYEEQLKYPVTVLSVILKQTYQPKQELMTNEEVSKMIYQAADIKQENPLQYYKILPGKGEVGGYSRVYMCERLVDG